MRRRGFGALALGGALAAAGCGRANAPGGRARTLRRGNGGEPGTLDPAYVQTQWEAWIAADLFCGLTTDGPDGRTIAGMAEHWDSSADRRRWTFRLRAAQWSDGAPLTAQDFVFAWRRVLDPKTASSYAAVLYPFANAEAIAKGTMAPEALGATADDARTLTISLEHPVPYLTELMRHFSTFPVPAHAVRAKGADWIRPENFVGNGAYTLDEWVPNDHIALVKNTLFFAAGEVKVDRALYYPTVDAAAALKRLRAGELDTQSPLPVAQIDWLRANMSDALQCVPDFAVYYVAMNLRRPVFADARIREALNLALDRESITGRLRRMGEPTAYNIVPPGIANYPGGAAFAFKDLPMAARLERARTRMREAGYGPGKPLQITYLTPSTTGAIRLAPALQAMWREVYCDVSISAAEPQIHYQRKGTGDYELAYSSWIADYDDAYNFLGIRLTSTSGMNDTGYANPRFDALMQEAQNTGDAGARGALMRKAEDIALADYAWIPYRFGVTPDLVRPRVKGWIANPMNINATRWLDLAPVEA